MARREVLFSGQDLDLVLIGDPAAGPLCITFSPFKSNLGEPASLIGFGEKFLADRGISALHFVSRANHWWNTPEMAPCLALAAPLAARARRRIGYGSSMGGYGCLRFAAALDLTRIMAFSPQFGVDPARVPWELRWQPDRSRLTTFDEAFQVPNTCEALVFYDPDGPDTQHIDLIDQHARMERIPMPGSGHFPLKQALERAQLGRIVTGVIKGQLSAAAIRQIVATPPISAAP